MLKIIAAFLLSFNLYAATQVSMTTTKGEIVIELDEVKAPITTANFIQYVKDGFYNGLIFHRVIKNFMIQGGGHKPDMTEAKTRAPIRNEANNGLSNLTGTIAMARTSNPHSATAQFFINTVDNARLDYQSESNWGYCVFGKVVKGMDVVNMIRNVPTATVGGHGDVPTEPIIIQSAKVL
jgi:cyclophilin family peptidyl-prolyl cis-trans isomerase